MSLTLTLTVGVGLPLVAAVTVLELPFIGWRERIALLTVYFSYIAVVVHTIGVMA